MIMKIVKWFPVVVFASLMCMPQLLDYSAFSTTFIPLLFLIWLMAIVSCFDVQLPRYATLLFLILLSGQLVLWATGQVHDVESMLLGLVWVWIAFMLLVSMPHVAQYTNLYLYSFVGIATVWAIVAAIVWLGYTDGNQLVIGGIALSHNAQPKPAGSFANGNVFGIMMVCAWLVSYKYWLENKRFSMWFGLLTLFFLTWVFISMSRGAWVALFVVYIMITIHLIYEKNYTRLFVLLLGSILAWLLASEMVSQVLMTVDLNSRAEEIITMNARQVLYPADFEIWRSHWLLGVGLGNFIAHFLTGQGSALAYLPSGLHGMGATSSAHNHLLHVLSTAGIVGLLTWLGITFLLFKSIWQVRFKVAHRAWFPLAMALVLWIQGLFNISMTEALPFFLFFMCLGLGVGLLGGEAFSRLIRLPKVFFLMTSTLIVFILVFYSYTTVQSWRTLEKALFTSSVQERGQYVRELFSQRNLTIYPYLIITVVRDSMRSQKGNAEYWKNIRPVIQLALKIQEAPELYQGLFYSELINENWDEACQLGVFLKQQHWENDKNTVAYEKACQSEKVDDFSIGW